MLTIEKLLDTGFFEAIPEMEKLCILHGIKHIYIIPPIISSDILYLMITTDEYDVEKFLNFTNSIKSIFKEKCNIQIYEESGIKEAVCEEDIFIEQYTYALNARISIDKLRKDVPLDSQWADEAKKQNRLIKNTHETLEQAKKPRNSSFSQESFNQFKKKRNHVFLKRRVDQLCPDPEYSEKNDYFKCRKT